MKSILVTLCLMAISLLSSTSCISANHRNQDIVKEIRPISGFERISITSVATVYFTQADTYSFSIEGPQAYVARTTACVDNGQLTVGLSNGLKNVDGDLILRISAPRLTAVCFQGVGSFNCPSPLRLDHVSLELQGVGKLNIGDLRCRQADIRVEGVGSATVCLYCERLHASVSGVGSVTLKGTAKTARFDQSGIGSIHRQQLHTEK